MKRVTSNGFHNGFHATQTLPRDLGSGIWCEQDKVWMVRPWWKGNHYRRMRWDRGRRERLWNWCGIWDLGSGVNRMRCEWCVHGEKWITIEEWDETVDVRRGCGICGAWDLGSGIWCEQDEVWMVRPWWKVNHYRRMSWDRGREKGLWVCSKCVVCVYI